MTAPEFWLAGGLYLSLGLTFGAITTRVTCSKEERADEFRMGLIVLGWPVVAVIITIVAIGWITIEAGRKR